ncbi:oligosaccharide flippase family protein [Neptuniibacter marinus]|uniref:oligosaccharide flippase family protein n=1 Tax=Neptuniibacter marinus TaxID=1806670 RepID=UPI0008359145|nr:oligosaccharide flippase family protein [Neptuniibacter marinus]
MIKLFFSNAAVYFLSTILSRGISLLMMPLYTSVLSPAEYGILDYLSIIGSFVLVVVALEISQAAARFVSEYRADSQLRKYYFSSAFLFSIFCNLLFVICCLFFSDAIVVFFFDDLSFLDVFFVAVFGYSATSIFRLVSNHLRFTLKVQLEAVLNIIYSLVVVLLSYFLMYKAGMGVLGGVVSLLVGSFFGIVIGLFFVREDLCFCKKYIFEMISFSWPFVFSSLGVVLSGLIDRLFVKEMLGYEDLGIYGVAFRIASIASVLIFVFHKALSPLIYSNYKEIDFGENLNSIFRYFSAFFICVFIVLSVNSDFFVKILTNEQYNAASDVIPFLVLSFVFSGMYFFAPGMGIKKKTKLLALINILGVFFNTGLNFFMVPLYGAIGAAIATAVSSFFVFCILFLSSQKLFFIPYEWLRVLLCVFFVAVSVFLFYLHGDFSIVYKLIVMFVSISFIFVFGVFRVLDFKVGLKFFS